MFANVEGIEFASWALLGLGWALARPGWRGRTLLDAAVALPLVFPLLALGFFLLLLLGRRSTLAPTIAEIEIPLGILTAAIGAPFFLWLLMSARYGWR